LRQLGHGLGAAEVAHLWLSEIGERLELRGEQPFVEQQTGQQQQGRLDHGTPRWLIRAINAARTIGVIPRRPKRQPDPAILTRPFRH
jgi:hypothetical protein